MKNIEYNYATSSYPYMESIAWTKWHHLFDMCRYTGRQVGGVPFVMQETQRCWQTKIIGEMWSKRKKEIIEDTTKRRKKSTQARVISWDYYSAQNYSGWKEKCRVQCECYNDNERLHGTRKEQDMINLHWLWTLLRGSESIRIIWTKFMVMIMMSYCHSENTSARKLLLFLRSTTMSGEQPVTLAISCGQQTQRGAGCYPTLTTTSMYSMLKHKYTYCRLFTSGLQGHTTDIYLIWESTV